MIVMKHSDRARRGLTTALRAQLKQAESVVASRRAELKKARTYLKYNLPGTKSAIRNCTNGVRTTLRQLTSVKNRIRKRQRLGQCYKIL